jgi:rhamnose transport system permease protein
MSRRAIRYLGSWEALLAVLALAGIVVASATTPGFASGANLAASLALMSEKSLLVLPLVMLVIAREIDISVASTAALSSTVAGLALRDNQSIILAVVLAVTTGLCCGALNGALVAGLGLPSLVVTLGTLALFRGLCYVLLGSTPVTEIPTPIADLGNNNIPNTYLPLAIIPFIILAPVVGLVLHRTVTGRWIYAIGGNPSTALYSGVRNHRVVFGLFLFAGVVSAIAGIISMGRTSQASPDSLFGYELDAITVVFLGGVSVLGGRGRMSGVIWALVLLIVLRSALQLHNVSAFAQGTAVGIVLIGSLLLTNLARDASARMRARRTRRPEPVPVGAGTTPTES